jgi:hypothetical protein
MSSLVIKAVSIQRASGNTRTPSLLRNASKFKADQSGLFVDVKIDAIVFIVVVITGGDFPSEFSGGYEIGMDDAHVDILIKKF